MSKLIDYTGRKHGLRRHKLYGRWRSMINRCCNPKSKGYQNYGGRGITVCDEWLHDVKAFFDWAISNGYREELSLDRIDNNKGYGPDNCRWVTRADQNRNQRKNFNITFNGETKTLAEWCLQYNKNYHTVRNRLKKGWSAEKALNTPIRIKRASK